jgi:hypothetical protein
MKKLIRFSSYILATVFALIIFSISASAAGTSTENHSALTGGQVFGGLVILLLVILIPLVRSSRKADLK